MTMMVKYYYNSDTYRLPSHRFAAFIFCYPTDMGIYNKLLELGLDLWNEVMVLKVEKTSIKRFFIYCYLPKVILQIIW